MADGTGEALVAMATSLDAPASKGYGRGPSQPHFPSLVAPQSCPNLTARNHIHCNPEAMHPASQHNPSNRADIRKVPTPPNGHVARRRE